MLLTPGQEFEVQSETPLAKLNNAVWTVDDRTAEGGNDVCVAWGEMGCRERQLSANFVSINAARTSWIWIHDAHAIV